MATRAELIAELNSRGLDEFGQPIQDEEIGGFENAFRMMGARATELGGQALAGVTTAGEALEETLPLGGFVFEEGSLVPRYAGADEFKQLQDTGLPDLIEKGADKLKDTEFNAVPTHTWDEVKRHFDEEGIGSGMAEVFRFAGETGVASVPDMVAVVLNLPLYVFARTEEMGAKRAENKGKARNDIVDNLEAAPFALGSAILERIVPRGFTESLAESVGRDALKHVAKKAGQGVAVEGGTEFVQEGILEYVGERYGTDAELKVSEGLEQGFAGMIAGGIYGGTVAGAGAAGGRALGLEEQRMTDYIDQVIDSATIGDVVENVDPFAQPKVVTSTEELAIEALKPGNAARRIINDVVGPANNVDELITYSNAEVTRVMDLLGIVEDLQPVQPVVEAEEIQPVVAAEPEAEPQEVIDEAKARVEIGEPALPTAAAEPELEPEAEITDVAYTDAAGKEYIVETTNGVKAYFEKINGQKKVIGLEVGDFTDPAAEKFKADVEAGVIVEPGKEAVQPVLEEPVTKEPVEGEVELSAIEISEDIENLEGDTLTITRTADVAMREVDDRINSIKLLEVCVRG